MISLQALHVVQELAVLGLDSINLGQMIFAGGDEFSEFLVGLSDSTGYIAKNVSET